MIRFALFMVAASALFGQKVVTQGVVACLPIAGQTACVLWEPVVAVAPGTQGRVIFDKGQMIIQVPLSQIQGLGVQCKPTGPNAYELMGELGNGNCIRLRQFGSDGKPVAWATHVLGAPSEPWDVVFFTRDGRPPTSESDLWSTMFASHPRPTISN